MGSLKPTYNQTVTLMSTLGFPEGTAPRNTDSQERSLQKINAALVDGLPTVDGLAPAPGTYDSVVMDPPDKPTTITYRTGGPTGTVVATLTLVYSGDDVASITRS
jgi:hypothetical protein